MDINEFKLERYFAKHEFSAKYLLSSSDCDGFSLNYVLEAASDKELALWENLKLGYTESDGGHFLRNAISRFYQKTGPENIVVATPGELNFILMNVLLEAEDHVITVSPSYQSLSEVAKSIGCNLSFWQADLETGAFNIDELEKLINKKTKLIILNFPHNPTGFYLNSHELNRIIDIARNNNVYLFSDEMYHKLMTGDMNELNPVSDLYEKGISLWGSSKSFGLAGLRIGWIVSQDKTILKKVLSFKDYLSICNSAPSEVLCMIALNHSNQFLVPNIKKIKKNIKHFIEFSDTHNALFKFIPPKAGSTGIIKLNIKESSLSFSNSLVERTGIMTVPAEMFASVGKFIRIGFGRENFSEILTVFDAYLNRHYSL